MKYAVGLLLVASLALNGRFLLSPRPPHTIAASNANSRPTYFTMHNIAAAQQHATGRGVKIGIIDHYFAFDAQRSLYAGGEDFLGDGDAFRKIGEHGLWLTRTAKEIAPDAEIYALNATCEDETKRVNAMVKAIDWAIAHNLDVLTYSNRMISPRNRPQLDAAIERATAAGLNCVFIHTMHPLNLLPSPMLKGAEPGYDRAPDVNVYHYDYNVLFLSAYQDAIAGRKGTPPYLSLSSTSVVVAGVLAMMRQVNGTLSPADYKRLLIETSHPYEAKTSKGPEVLKSCPHVIDALAAVERAEALRPASSEGMR